MSSIYYSLIESAKANQLDIQMYLRYALEEIQEQGEAVDYSKLTPYSEDLPDELQVK